MKRYILMFSSIFMLSAVLAQPAFAELKAYLLIPEIAGESQAKDYRDWIDLQSFYYPVIRSESATVGKGRSRSRAEVGPVEMGKWGDAASVYINLATLQGRSFPEFVVEIVDNGRLKFRYTFDNVSFVSYTSEMEDGGDRVHETMSINFESLKVLYIEYGQEGEPRNEHEISYDVAAGV